MAVAFVAERAKGGTTSATPAISVSGISTGNHVIILVCIATPASGTRSVSSVADDKGNTYQIDLQTASAAGGTIGIAVISAWIDPAKGAPATITLTMSASATVGYKVEEFSGLASTSWLDNAASGACTATTAQTTPSVTPAASGELAVAGGASVAAQASLTTGNIGGSASTQAGTSRNAASDVGFEYLLSCNSGAQTGAWTWATAPVSTNAGRNALVFYKAIPPVTPKSDSDSGSGADTASVVTESSSTSDTGSGADSATVTAESSSTSDTGAGVEASSLTVQLTASDAGTATETAAATVPVSGTDSGTGTDAISARGISYAETSSGADSATLVAQLPGSDGGTGSESPRIGIVVADSGADTEIAVISVPIAGSDTGTGSEAQTLVVRITATDTGTGTEATSISSTQDVFGVDSGTGTETASVTKRIVETDQGRGADTARRDWFLPIPPEGGIALTPFPEGVLSLVPAPEKDLSFGGAVVLMAVAPSPSYPLTPVDSLPLEWNPDQDTFTRVAEAIQFGLDFGHADESVAIEETPVLFDPDSGTGSETASLLTSVTDMDAGTVVENAGVSSSGQVFGFDNGTGDDSQASLASQLLDGDVNVLAVEVTDAEQVDSNPIVVESGIAADLLSLRALLAQADTGVGAQNQSVDARYTPTIVTRYWPSSTGSLSPISGGLSNPTRVSAADGSYATVSLADGDTAGERYGDFGFDALIPEMAEITLVQIDYGYKAGTNALPAEYAGLVAQMIWSAPADHSTTHNPSSTGDQNVTRDITAALSWTRNSLLDGTFFVTLGGINGSGKSATFSFDYLRVIVRYT